MTPKRLVLFVEGQGDGEAAPVLVDRLLTEYKAWDCLFLDNDPFRIGSVSNLVGHNAGNWIRWLKAAAKRRSIGAVLLLLDGDAKPVNKEDFCACRVAMQLAEKPREAGAGSLFSVACVFACQEYESWLIAGVGSLAGKQLPDGRPGIPQNATPPEDNLELTLRNAKGWLRNIMPESYKPTRDQAALTRLVDFQTIRDRKLRSFQRLESAIKQLHSAIQKDEPIVSP